MKFDDIFPSNFSGFLEEFGQNVVIKGMILVDGKIIEFAKEEANQLADYLRETIVTIVDNTAQEAAKTILIPLSELDEKERIKLFQLQLGLAWLIGRPESLKRINYYLEKF